MDDFAKQIGAIPVEPEDDFAKSIGAAPVESDDEFAKSIGAIPVETKPTVSGLESMAWGAASYGTADWADEILGFAMAAGKSFDPEQQKTFKELYRENQKLFDARIDAAKQQHPLLFHGTGVATLLAIPQGQAFATVKGATAFGALSGLGQSKAELLGGTKEDYKQAAWEAVKFAGFGATVGVAGKALGKLTKGTATKEISALEKPIGLDLTTKTRELLEKNRDVVESYGDILTNRKLLENVLDTPSNMKAADAVTQNINNFKVILGEMPAELTQQFTKDLTSASNYGKALETMTPIAERLGVSADDMVAYQYTRNQLRSFANFLQNKRAPLQSVEQTLDSLTKKVPIGQEIKQLIAQGRFSKENFRSFKGMQYITDHIANTNELNVLKQYKIKDPTSNFFKRNGYDLRVLLSELDDNAGTNFSKLADDIYSGSQRSQLFTYNFGKQAEALMSRANKESLPTETIAQVLAGKTPTGFAPNKAQQEVIDGFKKIYSDIRDKLNAEGAFVRERSAVEVSANELPSYFTQSPKPLVEYTTTLKKWADEDFIQGMLNRADLNDPKLFRKAKSELAPGSTKDLVKYKEFGQFVDGLERLNNTTIKSMDELKVAIKHIDEAAKQKAAMGYELGAAFRKKAELADKLRDFDTGRVFLKYINNSGKALYLDKPLTAMNAVIPALRQVGLNDAANYVNTFVMDASGVSRGVTKYLNEFSHGYNMAVERWFANNPDSKLKTLAVELPNALRRVTQSIYPNVIGANPKAIIRNYTQFLMTTAPDVGAGVSSLYGYKLATGALKDVLVNYKALGQELLERGLASDKFVGEGLQGAARTSMSKIAKTLGKALDIEENVMMSLFSQSDKVNRMISMQMGKRLAKDLVSGYAAKKAGLNLTKSQQVALSYVKRMESAYTIELKDILKKGADPRQIEDLMARYLSNKTQLVYGKLGAAELARTVGPVVSMFTKWPVSVTSELASSIVTGKTRGLEGTRIMAEKYMVPLIALMSADYMFNLDKPTPRQRELFSKEGLTYHAPIYSVADAMKGDFFFPPPVRTTADMIKPIVELTKDTTKTKQFQSKMKNALKKAAFTYTPFIAPYNAYKKLNIIVTNKDEK